MIWRPGGPIPDETTVLSFCHFLGAYVLGVSCLPILIAPWTSRGEVAGRRQTRKEKSGADFKLDFHMLDATNESRAKSLCFFY
jgi:hypothetical protein